MKSTRSGKPSVPSKNLFFTGRYTVSIGVLAAVLLLLLAPLSFGQWSSIDYSGSEVIVTDFMALHDDGFSIQAFSAVTQTWVPLMPSSGATIVGAGDWAALFELSDGSYAAYSARLNDMALLKDVDSTPMHIGVEDDVIFIGQDDHPDADFVVSGYSAQTNRWENQELEAEPFAFISSRFVAGFATNQFSDISVYGFGARKGEWARQDFIFCENAQADGNILSFDHVDDYDRTAAVFSGVLNTWAVSDPGPREPANMTKIDHNVALIFVFNGQASGLSAYTGGWHTSIYGTLISNVTEVLLADNIIAVQRIADPLFPKIEAFGSRPGTGWNHMHLADTEIYHNTEDVLLIERLGYDMVGAFSGLREGTWQIKTFADFFICYHDGDNSVLGRDAGNTYYAFSPNENEWSERSVPSGNSVRVGDSVAAVQTMEERWGYSTRWNTWVQGRPKDSTDVFIDHVKGSIFCQQKTAGSMGVGNFIFWNERSGRWNYGFETGGLVAGNVYVGRNLLMAETGPEMYGYSAQRGDWSPVPLTGFAYVDTALWVGDNVACFVDNDEHLYAFGSPAKTHIWYQWPLGTEYQTTRQLAEYDTEVRFTIVGETAWDATLLLSGTPYFPGWPIPDLGELYVRPPFIRAQPADEQIGWDGLTEGGLNLPHVPGAPWTFQGWCQGHTAESPPGTGKELVGNVPEPHFIF